jgi:glycosyltransferase involved in cell wall biosynthesis
MGFRYLSGTGRGLTADRQLGISEADSEFICFVDADQRLGEEQISRMLEEMIELKFDAINAGLSIQGLGWFCRAENEFFRLTHNVAGPKRMIGVAPTIFRSDVFRLVAFDSRITSTIDDTDFFYRLTSTTEFRLGRSREVVAQAHRSGTRAYLRKFWWYGKGDGEFCMKHPRRAWSMWFHLLARYPIVYPVRAIFAGYFRAAPYAIIQGVVRAMSALLRLGALLWLRLFRRKL